MKSTGIVRKVDELGRIVLPIELRRTMDIAEKDAIEIYVDGKRVQKHKMQAEIDDTDFTRYTYTIEKAFKVKEGQYIEVYFKAEDENGLKYTYLVDRSHVTNGDVETAESAIEAADSVQEGRLKVE